MWMKEPLGEHRKMLSKLLEPMIFKLAQQCIAFWQDVEQLNHILSTYFDSVPYCYTVYAMNKKGEQISANIYQGSHFDTSYQGQDLSRRPYSFSLYPKRHFMLSSVYISNITGRPCISAVQPVIDGQQFLGFIVADFDLRDLPATPLTSLVSPSPVSQPLVSPVKPSNKAKYLPNRRIDSPLDQHMGDVLSMLSVLIQQHGVFQCQIHFVSSQVALWQTDQPCEYTLFDLEQLCDPHTCIAYPRRAYPTDAKLPANQVELILERFRSLRRADEHIYLRSASLNINNALVSLSFSYDGSEYLSAETFLQHDLTHWFSKHATNSSTNLF